MPRALHHSDFQPAPVIAALAIAAVAGFSSGLALAGAWAGFWPVGPWWTRVAQAHAHAQLFGWIALFVFGVGFFFLPRMRGTPLTRPHLVPWVTAATAAGILLRAGGQVAGMLAVAAAGAALHAAGAAIGLFVLVETAWHGAPLSSRPGTRRVLPLLAPAFASFTAATLVSSAAAMRGVVIDARAERVVVELMLLGFSVPLVLAMSVQTLPLFLRLPPQNDRWIATLSFAHLACIAARIGSLAIGAERVAEIALACWGVVILAFIAMLDVVFRARTPWTADRKPWVDSGGRRQPRPGMPDFGEYGRFEWAVRSSYAWLAIAAVLSIAAAFVPVAPDAIRHAITAGFLTLVILGMAPRMLPGFSKRPLVRPGLVAVLAVLGNAMAFARVAPKALPTLPGGAMLLGISGALGIASVGLLAWILLPTLGYKNAETR